MHPILANRARSLLYLASWIPIAALFTAVLARGGAMPLGEAAGILVPMCLLYAFICQASWYLCVAVPLRENEIVRLCVTHATAAIVSAGAWVGIGWWRRTQGLASAPDAGTHGAQLESELRRNFRGQE